MNYLIKEISSAERRHILKNEEETFYHNRKSQMNRETYIIVVYFILISIFCMFACKKYDKPYDNAWKKIRSSWENCFENHNIQKISTVHFELVWTLLIRTGKKP